MGDSTHTFHASGRNGVPAFKIHFEIPEAQLVEKTAGISAIVFGRYVLHSSSFGPNIWPSAFAYVWFHQAGKLDDLYAQQALCENRNDSQPKRD